MDLTGATLRWLNESADRGVLITDAQLTIRGWNRWLERHSGYRAAEVIGRDLLNLYPELIARQLATFYRRALTGQVVMLAQRFHGYLLPMPAVTHTAGLAQMQQRAQIAPLLEDGQVIGTLTMIEDVTEELTREDELKRQVAIRDALQEIDRAILTLDLDECLRRVVEQTAALFHVPTAVVILREDDALRAEACTSCQPHGGPLEVAEMQGTVAEWVSRSGQMLVLTDLGMVSAPEALKPVEATSQSVAAIPFVFGDTVIGALAVESPHSHAFGPLEQDLLLALGRQAAVAIQNARLYLAERRRAEQLTAVARVARAVSATLKPEALYRTIYEHLSTLIPCDAFILSLFDPETRLIHAVFSLQDGTAHDVSHYPPVALQPPGKGTQSEVIHTGRSLIIPDLGARQKGLAVYRFGTPGPVTRSAIYVPLRMEGRTIGVLQAQSYTANAYRPEDIPLLEAAAGHAAAAIVNARLYQALHESETQLRRITDTMLDMVSQTDLNGILQYVSPSHQTVLGYSPQRLVGTSIFEHVHPDSSAATRPFREQLLQTRRVQRAEFRYRHADGHYLWLETSASVLESETGEPVGFVFGSRDVTARKQAEEALQRRTAQLETLRQVGLALTAERDLPTLLRSIVSHAMEFLGGSAGALMRYRPDLDRLESVAAIGSPPAMSTGTVFHRGEGFVGQIWEQGRPLVTSHDGEEGGPSFASGPERIPAVTLVGAPIQWGDEFLGVLVVSAPAPVNFTLDDGERLSLLATQAAVAMINARLYQQLQGHADRLEVQVRERTAEIQAQVARLEAILRSTADGIVVTDAQGQLLLTNPVVQRWLDELLEPAQAAQLRQTLVALARQADNRPEAVLELPGLDLQLQAAPVLTAQADPAAVVIAAHDISQLKALDRLKSQLVSNVSHELRTPVTAIKLYAHILRHGQAEKSEQYLDLLVQEADRQAKLVEDILEISRLDARQLELQFRATWIVRDLVAPVITGHQLLAQTGDLKLSYRALIPDFQVWVDPDRMIQVLNNLVENAMHYTPAHGEIEVVVSTAQYDQEQWATVIVHDTGIGIAPADLPHIFERFYRGETARQKQIPGTGLGLAIVKEVVELHKGRVTVESEENKGSTFTVWLPLVKTSSVALGEP